MSTKNCNCPCCGAPLEFSGASGKLECASCGNAFEAETIEALNGPEKSRIDFAMPEAALSDADGRGYTCKSCGAELMTDETTTATACPYCGSPTVLPARIDSGVKPEYVLPFKVSKKEAMEAFEGYFKGKKLMPNIFLNGKNRISDIRRLYVPYWLFDCDAEADIVFDAEKVHTERRGDWEIKTTEHYMVRRAGTMGFDCVPVDGSARLDDRIAESLEPFDYSAAVPFQPMVLAGAMADRADVDAAACEKRAVQRVENSIESAMRNTVKGYNSVRVRRRYVYSEGGRVTPVLAPVWMITTDKEEKGGKKTYTFAINGQTGKLTTDVKPDAGKSWSWGLGVFAGVMAVSAAALWALGSLASGTLLLAALAALIAALITVGVLRGQLKTASGQESAGNYVREGSFDLRICRDHFLYRSVERRKLESKEPEKK